MNRISSTGTQKDPHLTTPPDVVRSWSVRTAQPEDASAIISIIDRLNMERLEASEIGFLRQRHSQEEYKSFAQEGHIKVATINNQVVGFVVALPWNHPALWFERTALTIVRWSGESYADPDHRVFCDAIFVDAVGIDPQLHKIGIGRHLYGEIMNDHPQSNLVTTSMEAPLLNQGSAAFHYALGFNRVGEFAVSEFQGLSPYRCGVYLKEGARR